ncbi:MAG: sigma 54-interacting transcriptional regulator [Clostridia bacterium]|jgi:DNA-binding NtrC family response regulator/iron only hydrogenase large subunit-like protein|nr:sigma 54-interacting transcriptional regulator [Clostridia bacterium]
MAGIVSTKVGYCRSCFACVRNCPVKAIKVENGQAKVVPELCISCGHCVKVCAQGAKTIAGLLPQVEGWLLGGELVAACLAPSFVVEFAAYLPGRIISALKKAGFWQVYEVAFGADLVSREYHRLLTDREWEGPCISTACSAVVNLVEKHYPHLIPALAPIVSPMLAAGRYIKKKYGEEVKVVFIGPCIAKKEEAENQGPGRGVDAVLTFDELHSLLDRYRIDIDQAQESSFDNPPAGLGRIYPLGGGLLKSARAEYDLLQSEIIVVEGKDDCLQMLDALSRDGGKRRFIDALFCEGCINGPMISSNPGLFKKRELVVSYYTRLKNEVLKSAPESEMEVPLSRQFLRRDRLLPEPDEQEIKVILAELDKFTREDELNCGACGYSTCREKAVAVYRGLAENKMCLPYLINRLEEHNLRLRQQLKGQGDNYGFIGNSRAMQEVRGLIAKIAATDCTVLLRGESGTGKDLAAKAIHRHSLRSEQTFVVINCAALPENLLESELFGYVKGAFTGAFQSKKGLFEEAHGGTIFLDEIGDISPSIQGKLLRVLQQGEFFRIGDSHPRQVDVRVIAATNQDLEKMVEDKRFRLDLFYRLNVVSITLPPLREKREDIPLLAKHFLTIFNEKHGKNCTGFDHEVMKLLEMAPWPGNVRQLENLVERAVILCDGPTITGRELPSDFQEAAGHDAVRSGYREAVQRYEKKLVVEALREHGWVQAKAAAALGLNRSTLHEIMKRLDIKK